MKKKLLVLNTTLMLGLGSAFSIPAVKADSIDNQRAEVQASLTKADQELASVLKDLAHLNTQMKKVDQAIIDNNKMAAKTEEDIASTKSEIAKLEDEMASIKERIEKRSLVLKERAQSYQESGGNIAYLDVLLGATSFSDFIDRVGAVTTIMDADQDILLRHEADKEELEEKKSSVEKKLADLNDMKVELEGMRSQMEEQKKQNEELKKQLEVKENETAALKAELQLKDSDLASKQLEIEQSIQGEQSDQSVQNSTEKTITSSSKSSDKSSKSTSKAPAKVTSAKASGSVSTVINAGNKYIGNSVYVFGGGRTASDIANGRFDCSGFVHWAFSQAGISVGSSTDSLKNSGTRVSPSNMKPGDLVFFNTYKTDGHVGIYIGGGKFIGSQSSTGVAIANMSSGYWKGVFSGRVVRIIN